MKSSLKAKRKKFADRFQLTGTQVATNLSELVTVITNISGYTLSFGFIPPHGVELDNNEAVTVTGDLRNYFFAGGGRQNKRKADAFQNAIDDKIIRVHVNKRHIVYGAVDAGTTITAGDLVYLATDDIRPASSFTWDTNLATTQTSFANSFLGVALDSHVPADGAITNFPVDISPTSLYTFNCTSEAHEVGDLMGPAKQSGNALENQKLEKVASAAYAVARAFKRDASAATVTAVNIQSAYWGNSAAAAQ